MPSNKSRSVSQNPEPESEKPAITSSRMAGNATFRFTSGVSGTYMEDAQSDKQTPGTES